MNYFNMIKSEDTDNRYEAWGKYRQELTTYIKTSLQDSCSKDSWIAIWGAGGCNDIEIIELAKSYKLLLIDQDVDKLYQVRERLGLNSDNCKVADVGFWNISDDDYEMFQALLFDGADFDELECFMTELVEKMTPAIDLSTYSVEGSVVVGLASQLNARFAALLHINKDKIAHIPMERIIKLLNHLNSIAIEKLYISVRQITKKLIISGYELESCYNKEQCKDVSKRVEATFEEGVYGGLFLSGDEESFVKVAGNEFWHRILYKAIIMGKLEDAGRCQIICWPFTKDKYYPMLLVTLLVC